MNLQRIKELLQKATPVCAAAAKCWHGLEFTAYIFRKENPDVKVIMVTGPHSDDVELICALRNEIPEIIARMEKLEEVANSARSYNTDDDGPLSEALARLDGGNGAGK